MQWQFLMVAHSILSGYRMIATRKVGLDKKDASLYALIISFACVWLLGIIFVIVKNEPLAVGAVYENSYFIIAGGFLFGIANFLTLRLFRLVSASVAVILTLLNNLAVVLIATIFGGEVLTVKQVFGMALIIIGIVITELIAFRSKKRQKSKAQFTVLKSLLVTFILSLVFALGVVNEKHLLQELPLTTYLLFGWGAQFFAALILFLALGGWSKCRGFAKTTHRNVWISAVLLAISGLFFVISLERSDSSSQATVASSFKVIVAMVLAYVLLHERTHTMQKIYTTLLSIAGLLLLLS